MSLKMILFILVMVFVIGSFIFAFVYRMKEHQEEL